MSFPEFGSKSIFEEALYDFTSSNYAEQLRAARTLLDQIREREEMLINIIRYAGTIYEAEEFNPDSFATKIQAELQRRAIFIDATKQQLRETLAERLLEIEDTIVEDMIAGRR